jgi:transcriptional regulator with XRE-family HTH domain
MKVQTSFNWVEPRSDPFHERLRTFRDSRGLSRAALAAKLGVTQITLYRWETGSTRPSPLVAEKLTDLGFGAISHSETNVASVPRLKPRSRKGNFAAHALELRDSGRIRLCTQGTTFQVLTAPFVRNGPPDQSEFHQKLLSLQVSSDHLSSTILLRRLSMIEEVEGFGATAQHLLERPRSTAVAWNSNYGTHGWHRYVGRFPPHVVRALLNFFGANGRTVVCDPFAGSGTTAVECRLLGIPFVGIEICPLSCLMIRTKAAFPSDAKMITDVAQAFMTFYNAKWNGFLKGREISQITHGEILDRTGNPIPAFTNIERWFTPEALLGVSIAVEYGLSLDGFGRDATLLALSSRMRSIGNVDVDVVRAEYSRCARKNVRVGPLVFRQLIKMAGDVAACLSSHQDLIGAPAGIVLHEASVLDADLPEESIDHVITSPPYGIEAISYLRTHLLSYRTLFSFFGHDPYDTRAKTIGSEYIGEGVPDSKSRAAQVSQVFQQFFSKNGGVSDSKYQARRAAMMQFFDDMLGVGERLSKWLKGGGQVAFIIGNKKLGDAVIPTDNIVRELFASTGLEFIQAIQHKLKTNNSNSQVPWQERIIQEESILLFRRARRCR